PGSGTPTPDTTNDTQAAGTTATFDIPGASGGGADPADDGPPAAAAAGGIATSTTTKKAKKKVAKKGGGKPKKPLWLRLTVGTLIGVGLCMLLGVIGFGVAYATIPVPDGTKAAATEQGSTFYYADGETEFAYRGTDREPLKYDEIPEVVQDAAISAEDRGFWTEPGVSVTGTLRAVWSTVTGQQVQGGSTITQQMVRGYYDGVSKDKTITRKVKEIVISLKVDQSKDKKWVMEQYLNTIYFGRQAYGIQAAAQAYFHKDVGELNASEAAFLAAAIQQPSLFGQADEDYTPSMESRWQYVINGMVELNSEDPETGITQAEADKAEFPTPDEQTPQSDLSGYKGYMFQQAMRELEKLGYNEDLINRGGYKIVTTFDEDLMKKAKEAVESTSGMDSLPDDVRAGMASIEPSTGEVKSFYGGKDFIQNQYDSAFSGSAQSGSAFKPYTLAAALQEGYSVDSVVDGSSPMSVPGGSISNAGGHSYGPLTLAQATAKSSNTAYARLNKQVGGDKTAAAAEAAGIPASRMTKEQRAAASFPLGISSLRPMDQANGFATFANGGEYIEAHVVREIVNKEGENERPEVKRNQAFPEHVANDVTYALETVVNGGTGSNAALGRPAAGKTGTTDNNVATWFVGYTPQLATAMTVYSTDNKPVVVPGWGVVQGGSLSASVWQKFMTQAMEGKDIESFPGRSGDGTIENWAPNVPEPEPDTPQQNQGQQEPEPQPQLPPDNGAGGGNGNGGGDGTGDGGGGTPPPSGGDGTGGGQEPDPGGDGSGDVPGGGGNEGGDFPQPGGGGGTVGPG
ncbi:transglycosylase domain-containing protein, partial [Nocardiopsis gilva]